MITFESESEYLKQSDLPVEGKLCIISSVPKTEEIGPEKEKKYVLHTHQFEKGLVLNNTNGNILISLFGDDETQWVGKEFVLYRDPTITYGGKVVGGLRIRMAPPRTSADPSDDVPF